MDKLHETRLGPGGKVINPPLRAPAGVDPERFETMRTQKAVMNATLTPGGSVTVNCPYCLIYMKLTNPVDVTRFVDRDGKKEYKAVCAKGHDLRFRTIDAWREERMDAGLQVRP